MTMHTMVRHAARLCLFGAILLLPVSMPVAAQGDDRAQVRQAALDYVEGFYEGDSAKLVRSVRPEVYKFGFFKQRDATAYTGEQMTWAGFFNYARSVKARNRPVPPDWPKDIVIYDVLDQTASVKLTASWGIDYLLMAKFDGKWMITHVLWQVPPPR